MRRVGNMARDWGGNGGRGGNCLPIRFTLYFDFCSCSLGFDLKCVERTEHRRREMTLPIPTVWHTHTHTTHKFIHITTLRFTNHRWVDWVFTRGSTQYKHNIYIRLSCSPNQTNSSYPSDSHSVHEQLRKNFHTQCKMCRCCCTIMW